MKHILWVLIKSTSCISITKTYPDPLKLHFYIVKLKFTGVHIIFLISAQKNLCFEQKYEKIEFFYLKIFRFLEVKFSIYLNRHVYVMKILTWIHVLHRA